MEERIDLAVLEAEQGPRRGVSIAVGVSIVIHALLITWLVLTYHPVSAADEAPPIARYVELIRQNPEDNRQFVEAPGKKLERPPAIQSQLSDANREASAPHPTGDQPTLNPGNGHMYAPQSPSGNGRQRSAASPTVVQQPQNAGQPSADASAQQAQPQTQSQSMQALVNKASATPHGAIDWKSAIKEVGKVASLGTGQQGLDLGNGGGGQNGFVREGPISFETTWYDWGDYAQSMVARIRVNWYNIMPDLLKTGMQGVVTIRFTIHRDGRISDVTILNSSGIPPYDFAAKKAIENSSPLNALPKDFPMDTERVTAMFYYNLEPPSR